MNNLNDRLDNTVNNEFNAEDMKEEELKFEQNNETTQNEVIKESIINQKMNINENTNNEINDSNIKNEKEDLNLNLDKLEEKENLNEHLGINEIENIEGKEEIINNYEKEKISNINNEYDDAFQHEFLRQRLKQQEEKEKVEAEAERIRLQQKREASRAKLANKHNHHMFNKIFNIWFGLNINYAHNAYRRVKSWVMKQPYIPIEFEDEWNNTDFMKDPSFDPASATASGNNNNVKDERICKFCFGGVDDEPELGRLISPCKCKGTMKYVHIKCLNEWRSTSANKSSFYQCDQCKYKYHFQRTSMAKLISNKLIVFLITLLALYLILFFTGFIVKIFLMLTKYRILDLKLKKVPFFDVGYVHHFYGFIVIGFYGLIKLFAFYIFDIHRGTYGLNRNNNNREDKAVIIIMLIIGCIKVLVDLYKVVNDKCRKSLLVIEDHILEVQDDD